MRFHFRWLTALALGALLGPGLPLHAQRLAAGPHVAQILRGGAGIERNCLEQGYHTGLGGRAAWRVLTDVTALVATVRFYRLPLTSTCVDGLPPPDGTYTTDDRTNLQSTAFSTTDLRVRATLGAAGAPFRVAVGVGNAWHPGHDLPYLAVEAEQAVVLPLGLEIAVGAEYQHLRVTSDRTRRTYRDFQLVARESLGKVREWSPAFLIGLSIAWHW